MYKDNPFKMYKIFEEIYYLRNYDSMNTYLNLEKIVNPFNKKVFSEYINYEYQFNSYYERRDNIHILRGREESSVRIGYYNVKIVTDSNYTDFFKYINKYSNRLFVCDFANKDYFWLWKLKPLQRSASIVK